MASNSHCFLDLFFCLFGAKIGWTSKFRQLPGQGRLQWNAAPLLHPPGSGAHGMVSSCFFVFLCAIFCCLGLSSLVRGFERRQQCNIIACSSFANLGVRVADIWKPWTRNRKLILILGMGNRWLFSVIFMKDKNTSGSPQRKYRLVDEISWSLALCEPVCVNPSHIFQRLRWCQSSPTYTWLP